MDLETNTLKPTNVSDESKQSNDKLRNQALEKINIVYQIKKKMNKKESNSDITSKDDSSQSEVISISYMVP